MLQTLGLIAMMVWALATDPTVVVRNIDAPDPTASPSAKCHQYRYLLEIRTLCPDVFQVGGCGIAVHSASTPCDAWRAP